MKTLLIVSGASRGIGRAVAVAFASHKWDGSSNAGNGNMSSLRALLLARSGDGLDTTASLMREAAAHSRLPLVVTSHSIDLSDLSGLSPGIKAIFSSVSVTEFERAILINNAGDLGHIGLTTDLDSLRQLQESIDFNITSSLWISAQFVKTFSARRDFPRETGGSLTSCVVVNMSSLCAVQPFLTMGVYCATKAARNMFHATMAAEMSKLSKKVKILNYAPGAADTQMQDNLRNCTTLDGELLDYFVKSKDDSTLVKPAETAERLKELVMKNCFTSGAHIDYFDVARDDHHAT